MNQQQLQEAHFGHFEIFVKDKVLLFMKDHTTHNTWPARRRPGHSPGRHALAQLL